MARESLILLTAEAVLALLFLTAWKALSAPLGLVLAALVFCLMGFTVFFFRDPRRHVVEKGNGLLSPADGKIIAIEEVNPAPFLDQPAVRVSIFLSVWDVHVNRVPASGRTVLVSRKPGGFRPAYEPEAGHRNEQVWIGIETRRGPVLVKQVAGILARRIVCRLREGDRVRQGDRYGMIKFGSRVELWAPRSIRLLVSEGDKVKGGITILGEFADGS